MHRGRPLLVDLRLQLDGLHLVHGMVLQGLHQKLFRGRLLVIQGLVDEVRVHGIRLRTHQDASACVLEPGMKVLLVRIGFLATGDEGHRQGCLPTTLLPQIRGIGRIHHIMHRSGRQEGLPRLFQVMAVGSIDTLGHCRCASVGSLAGAEGELADLLREAMGTERVPPLLAGIHAAEDVACTDMGSVANRGGWQVLLAPVFPASELGFHCPHEQREVSRACSQKSLSGTELGGADGLAAEADQRA